MAGCHAKVWDRFLGTERPCAFRPSADGIWCKQHSPAAKAKRQEAQNERWQRDIDLRNAKAAVQEATLAAANAVLAAYPSGHTSQALVAARKALAQAQAKMP